MTKQFIGRVFLFILTTIVVVLSSAPLSAQTPDNLTNSPSEITGHIDVPGGESLAGASVMVFPFAGKSVIFPATRDPARRAAAKGTAVPHFPKPSAGSWTERQELQAADGAPIDLFGNVALSAGGEVALVGAAGKDAHKGAAYIFD